MLACVSVCVSLRCFAQIRVAEGMLSLVHTFCSSSSCYPGAFSVRQPSAAGWPEGENGSGCPRVGAFFLQVIWPARPPSMDGFCFCFQATADPSVISCLHNLSRRIAIVLQHEERRCQYLTREAKLILAIQDEVSAMSESEPQAVYGLVHLGCRFPGHGSCRGCLPAWTPELKASVQGRLF